MKKFAIYLPQFHEIKENNEWWGQGFTEWTHVKAAEPLFEGHIQPKTPYQMNYYNLMDKETVIWQTNTAKEYGIDGFAYYHYYFNGKLIMEKPAENLLRWTDIDQKFFFCWANHTWYQGKGKSRKELIKQEYGDEKDWNKHIEYLLPFFKDNRYEKHENKPVFLIYDSIFLEKKAMVQLWDKRCKEEGFDGIYIIETFRDDPRNRNQVAEFSNNLTEQTQAIFMREPSTASSIYVHEYPWLRVINKLRRMQLISPSLSKSPVATINGDTLYKLMIDIDYKKYFDKPIIRGLYFEWDNTPRHRYKGYIITPPSKENFKRLYGKLHDDDYCIINAWNEWAEGMMLEPTEENGYKYLEWLREADDEFNKLGHE